MNVRVAELIAGDGVPLDAPGDNFLVDLDLSEEALPVGAHLRLGSALLEVSPRRTRAARSFASASGSTP